MKSTNLLKELDDHIVKKLLKAENATQFYLDSILFDNEMMQKACEKILQKNIDKILSEEKGTQFMLNLPFKNMCSLCDANDLCVKSERSLLDLFEKYLKHRDTLPLLPEEDPSKNWDHLTAEEKENRNKLKEEEAKVAADKEAEE